MSWFGRQILSREEVHTDAINHKIPASMGPGDECTLFIQLDEESPRMESLQAIDGYVVGVSIGARHAIYFDVAVPIKGTLFYAVINDVRGWIRPKGEITDPATGDLIGADVLEEAMERPENKRRFFHVVKTNTHSEGDGNE